MRQLGVGGACTVKCPVCWAEKAYRREAKSKMVRMLAAFRIVMPMKCHHCYHLFNVHWLRTLGQQTQQPLEKTSVQTHLRLSYAAEHLQSKHRFQTGADVCDHALGVHKSRRMAA